MARSVLETVIKIVKEGGGDKETIGAIANVKNSLASAGIYAATFTAAAFTVKKMLDDTVGSWVDYALAMDDGRKVTNMSVEEFSRLVQAADDLRISQETVVAAMQFAVRQGYQPSIEWLQKVADQYNQLPTGAERGAFAIKTFGRTAGPELQRLLEQGSAAVEQLMASIGDGMIVTNESVTEAKKLALAEDALQDSWTETKNIIGRDLVPALADGLTWFNKYADSVKSSKESWMQYVPILQTGYYIYNAIKMALQGNTDATEENSGAVQENVAARIEAGLVEPQLAAAYEMTEEELKALSDEYKTLIGLTFDIQSASDSYQEKLADLQEKASGLRDRITELESKKYLTPDQKTELDGLQTELEDVQTQIYDAGEEAEKAGKKIVFNLLTAKLSADGLTDAEFNLLIQTGKTFGLIDEKSADSALAINGLNQEFADGNIPLGTYQRYIESIMALPQVMSKEVWVKWVEESGYGKGGGGGGGKNKEWTALGGEYLVTKPTWFMIGEAGPERATISPLGYDSKGSVQSLTPLANMGGGPTVVQVFIDGRMVSESIARGLAAQGF